jgi:hypothetical protein
MEEKNYKIVMRILYTFLLCVSILVTCNAQTSSPSQDKNYVIVNTPLTDGVKDPSQLTNKPIEEVNQTVQYFDGLGRPIQTIDTKSSPAKNDVVSPQEYDVYGHEVKKYLPYTSDEIPGSFKPNALYHTGSYTSGDQYLFYQGTSDVAEDEKPFGESIIEASPLDRVVKQGSPGVVWQALPIGQSDRAVETKYLVNGTDEVLLFDYDVTSKNVVFNSLTYYAPNQLYLNKTIDEEEHEVIAYVDKDGKTILKKVEYKEESGTKLYAETYYIYDDFGSLVVVLPPEAVVAIKSSLSN